jgi:hypothetical protein
MADHLVLAQLAVEREVENVKERCGNGHGRDPAIVNVTIIGITYSFLIVGTPVAALFTIHARGKSKGDGNAHQAERKPVKNWHSNDRPAVHTAGALVGLVFVITHINDY